MAPNSRYAARIVSICRAAAHNARPETTPTPTPAATAVDPLNQAIAVYMLAWLFCQRDSKYRSVSGSCAHAERYAHAHAAASAEAQKTFLHPVFRSHSGTSIAGNALTSAAAVSSSVDTILYRRIMS